MSDILTSSCYFSRRSCPALCFITEHYNICSSLWLLWASESSIIHSASHWSSPPSSIPVPLPTCHSCGPRGHGRYDPVWAWWRRRKSGGWGDGLFVLSGVVPLHSSVVSLSESCSGTPRTSSVFAHIIAEYLLLIPAGLFFFWFLAKLELAVGVFHSGLVKR